MVATSIARDIMGMDRNILSQGFHDEDEHHPYEPDKSE
jgi:hypothetical protein